MIQYHLFSDIQKSLTQYLQIIFSERSFSKRQREIFKAYWIVTVKDTTTHQNVNTYQQVCLDKPSIRYRNSQPCFKPSLDIGLVEKQGTNGLWMDFTANDNRDNSIRPRFNLWYAEALLAFDLTGEKKYVLAALKSAQTYKKIQSKDGTFFLQKLYRRPFTR